MLLTVLWSHWQGPHSLAISSLFLIWTGGKVREAVCPSTPCLQRSERAADIRGGPGLASEPAFPLERWTYCLPPCPVFPLILCQAVAPPATVFH